jgi:hypothetical protein
MKITVEIDCTPDEARQFFGLPDVKPLQAAIMDKLEKQTLEAADRFSPDAMLRSWMSFAPQGADTFRDMFERFFRAAPPQP